MNNSTDLLIELTLFPPFNIIPLLSRHLKSVFVSITLIASEPLANKRTKQVNWNNLLWCDTFEDWAGRRRQLKEELKISPNISIHFQCNGLWKGLLRQMEKRKWENTALTYGGSSANFAPGVALFAVQYRICFGECGINKKKIVERVEKSHLVKLDLPNAF